MIKRIKWLKLVIKLRGDIPIVLSLSWLQGLGVNKIKKPCGEGIFLKLWLILNLQRRLGKRVHAKNMLGVSLGNNFFLMQNIYQRFELGVFFAHE